MSILNIKTLHKTSSATQVETTLEERLNSALENKPARLVFDLAGLKFATSIGIRLFLLAGKKQRAHQGQVSFVNLQPQIREVFDIMGSMPDMQVFANQAELDAYLLARQRTHLS